MAKELFVPYAIPGRTVKFLNVSPDESHAWMNANPPVLVTYDSANLGTYAIAGTYSPLSQGYYGNMPANMPIGTILTAVAKDQAGGSLLEADTTIGSATNQAWNGTSLVSASDTVSSGGIGVSAASGKIVSASGTGINTGVVLDPADKLVLAASNLQGYTISILGKSTHGIITDAGTTATRVVAGGWLNGPTPSPGDTYSLKLAPAATMGPLPPNGLDNIQIETGINARQAMSPILAAAAGVVSGAGTGVIVIKGGNTSATRITGTTDDAGNRSSVTLTLPN